MSTELVTPAQGRILVQLEHICHTLAEVKTLDEAKQLRDQAEAIRHYLKEQEYGLEAANHAAEIKLRAERRLGELLQEMPNAPQGKPSRFAYHDGTQIPRLDELGISRNDSSRWQRIANVPQEHFERHVAEVLDKKQELTSAGVLRLARGLQQPGKGDATAAPESPESCTTADLEWLAGTSRRFGTVYADPPWQYENQATRASTDNHYRTLSVAEIAALPVAGLVAENAHLHLWTTNAFLFDARQILESWGFTYKSVFVWCKPQMGIGNYWRVSHEFLLLGVRGRCPFRDHGLMSWAELDRGQHSAKPEQVRSMVEKAGHGPYLELFGRLVVDGWTVWGDQIERDLFHRAVGGESNGT